MSYLKSFFTPVLLFFTLQFGQAQLSTNSRIWSGSMALGTSFDEITVSVLPNMHYFLTPRFTLGSALSLQGGLSGGVRQILAAPEARFYFNPWNEDSNWFALAGTQLSLFDKQGTDNRSIFHIRMGMGMDLTLADGLMWEGRLFGIFQRRGNNPIFTYPGVKLENNLVYFMNAVRRASAKEVLPLISRGSWMIAGTGPEVNLTQTSSFRNFLIGFAPKAGYFLTERLIAGFGFLLYYHSQSTDFTIREQNFGSQTTSWGYEGSLRYFLGSLQGRLRPFVELSQEWHYSKSHFKPFNTIPPEERDFRIVVAYIRGGVDIFLSHNVALETGLHIRRDMKTGKMEGGIDLGFAFFLQ